MKITLTMLLTELQKEHKDIAITNNCTDHLDSFEGIRLLPYQKELTDISYLYFSQEGHPIISEEVPVHLALIYVCRTILPPEGFPVITIQTDSEPAIIFNSLQSIYIRYKNWDRDMNNCLIEQKELQDMMNISEALLNLPAIIYDNSLKVLAYSQNINLEDPVFSSATTLGSLPSQTLATFERLNMIERIKNQKYIIESNSELTHASIIHKIEKNQSCCGYCVFLLPSMEHLTFYQHLMENFLENVSILLIRKQESYLNHSYIYESLLNDLMNETDLDLTSLKDRLSYVGLPFESQFFLLQLKLDAASQLSKDFFIRSIQDYLENAYVFRYHNHILILLYNSSIQEHSYPESFPLLYQQFSADLKLHHIICAVSLPFRQILELSSAQKQTDATLNLVSQFTKNTNPLLLTPPGANPPFYFYKNYRLYDSCRHQLGALSRLSIIDSRILHIKEHDKQKHTNYLKILSSYLEHNLQKNSCAGHLHMHRNNVVYHLNRMENLFSIHFEDLSDILQLYLGLICLDVETLQAADSFS